MTYRVPLMSGGEDTDGDTDEASVSVEIDGELDDARWKDISPLLLDPFGGGSGPTSQVQVFASDTHLFVGGKFEDRHVWSTLEERDSKTWTQEVFELFVDPNGDGKNYLELQINPLGTIFDAKFDVRLGTGEGSRKEQIDRAKAFDLEGLESAVHVEGSINDEEDEDEFWSVELKIPFASMPGVKADDVQPGTTWAVNLYRFDRPSKDETRSFAWSTRPRGDFHQVDKFGVFRFVSPSALKSDELQIDPKKLQENLQLDPQRLKQPNVDE